MRSSITRITLQLLLATTLVAPLHAQTVGAVGNGVSSGAGIERNIPGLIAAQSTRQPTAAREVQAPTLNIPSGEVPEGKVRSVDVTVLKLHERTVRLRVTNGPPSLPAAPSSSWPSTAALVAVRLDVVSIPRS